MLSGLWKLRQPVQGQAGASSTPDTQPGYFHQLLQLRRQAGCTVSPEI